METSISIKDSLKIEIEKIESAPNTTIFKLDGLIDTYNSLEFQKEILSSISTCTNIIFDCSNLTYVSSTGVGAFTVFLKTSKEKNGNILLINLQPKVLEIFQLLGFSKFFTITDRLEDGLKMLGIPQSISDIFPKIFECPSCKKKLKASKAGKYRCIQCSSILNVAPNGTVSI